MNSISSSLAFESARAGQAYLGDSSTTPQGPTISLDKSRLATGFSTVRASRRARRILPDLLGRFPMLAALFGDLDEARSLEIEEALDWVGLEAGVTLFEQGDLVSDVFLLTTGQLAVQIGTGSLRRTVALFDSGRIGRGDGAPCRRPRARRPWSRSTTATLFACRAGRSTCCSKPRLKARSFLFRTLSTRLRQNSHPGPSHGGGERIAIVPLGPVDPLRETLDWLSREVSPIVIGSATEEDRWERRPYFARAEARLHGRQPSLGLGAAVHRRGQIA